MNLSKREGTNLRVFLMGDGVQCAVKGQDTPQGCYNVERMLRSLVRRGEVAPEAPVRKPEVSGRKS
jgi:uncharacterized protein involved in oxidation of intracellular sulfur